MDSLKKTGKKVDLRVMKDAIRRYYQKHEVSFPDQNIRVGNAQIDGEVILTDSFKIAVELKGPGDRSVVKGVGQLVEAAVNGYQQGILVVTEKRGQTINRRVFERLGIGLVTVTAEDQIKFLVQARNWRTASSIKQYERGFRKGLVEGQKNMQNASFLIKGDDLIIGEEVMKRGNALLEEAKSHIKIITVTGAA